MLSNERLQELKRKVNGLAGKSDLTYQDEVLIDELIDSAMKPKEDCSNCFYTELEATHSPCSDCCHLYESKWQSDGTGG